MCIKDNVHVYTHLFEFTFFCMFAHAHARMRRHFLRCVYVCTCTLTYGETFSRDLGRKGNLWNSCIHCNEHSLCFTLQCAFCVLHSAYKYLFYGFDVHIRSNTRKDMSVCRCQCQVVYRFAGMSYHRDSVSLRPPVQLCLKDQDLAQGTKFLKEQSSSFLRLLNILQMSIYI